jgi:hypothetical protein
VLADGGVPAVGVGSGGLPPGGIRRCGSMVLPWLPSWRLDLRAVTQPADAHPHPTRNVRPAGVETEDSSTHERGTEGGARRGRGGSRREKEVAVEGRREWRRHILPMETMGSDETSRARVVGELISLAIFHYTVGLFCYSNIFKLNGMNPFEGSFLQNFIVWTSQRPPHQQSQSCTVF